jgi:hypothetical protein
MGIISDNNNNLKKRNLKQFTPEKFFIAGKKVPKITHFVIITGQ